MTWNDDYSVITGWNKDDSNTLNSKGSLVLKSLDLMTTVFPLAWLLRVERPCAVLPYMFCSLQARHEPLTCVRGIASVDWSHGVSTHANVANVVASCVLTCSATADEQTQIMQLADSMNSPLKEGGVNLFPSGTTCKAAGLPYLEKRTKNATSSRAAGAGSAHAAGAGALGASGSGAAVVD